jgi:trk system potassium uptake protein TrkH
MRIKSVLYYLGFFNIIIFFTSIFNLLFCYYFDFKINTFSYLLTSFISVFFFILSKNLNIKKKDLKLNDLLLFVLLGWIFYPLILSIPYILGNYSNFMGSYFESVSGFTSFGGSIFLKNLNLLDTPILIWRNFTQVVGSIFFVLSILTVLGHRDINFFPLKFITKQKDSLIFEVNFFRIFFNINYAFLILFLITIFLLNFTHLRLLDKFNLALTFISSGGFLSSDIVISSNVEKIIFSTLFILSSLNIFLILGILKIFDSYFFNEDKYLLIFYIFVLLLFILFYRNINFSDLILLTSSAISTSGINFTGTYYPNLTFLCLSLTFFGGAMVSSTSGLKLSRIMIILNKIYLEFGKLLAPSSVLRSTIFNSKEKITSKDFFICVAIFVSYLLFFCIYSLFLTYENFAFDQSFITAVLVMFNTLPSTLYLENSVQFILFSDFTLAVTIVALIISKISPLSLLLLYKYRSLK